MKEQYGSDAAIAVGLRAQQPAALDAAWQRHGRRVRAMARQRCGEHGDDVAQDVFLRLWQRPDRYRPESGTLLTFLLHLTVCRSIDVLRSDGSRIRREDRERFTTPPQTSDLAGDVSDRHVVEAALERLSPDHRAAIRLAFFEGLTYQQVAAELGIPEGTAKARIRAGLLVLRRALEHDGTRPPLLAA